MKRTDCDGERLCEYLDGELSAEQRALVEAHLRECAACREELVALRRAAAAVRALPRAAAPATLREEIRRAVAGAEEEGATGEGEVVSLAQERVARRRYFQTAAASVAAFLAAGVIAYLFTPSFVGRVEKVAGRARETPLLKDSTKKTARSHRRAGAAREKAVVPESDRKATASKEAGGRRRLAGEQPPTAKKAPRESQAAGRSPTDAARNVGREIRKTRETTALPASAPLTPPPPHAADGAVAPSKPAGGKEIKAINGGNRFVATQDEGRLTPVLEGEAAKTPPASRVAAKAAAAAARSADKRKLRPAEEERRPARHATVKTRRRRRAAATMPEKFRFRSRRPRRDADSIILLAAVYGGKLYPTAPVAAVAAPAAPAAPAGKTARIRRRGKEEAAVLWSNSGKKEKKKALAADFAPVAAPAKKEGGEWERNKQQGRIAAEADDKPRERTARVRASEQPKLPKNELVEVAEGLRRKGLESPKKPFVARRERTAKKAPGNAVATHGSVAEKSDRKAKRQALYRGGKGGEVDKDAVKKPAAFATPSRTVRRLRLLMPRAKAAKFMARLRALQDEALLGKVMKSEEGGEKERPAVALRREALDINESAKARQKKKAPPFQERFSGGETGTLKTVKTKEIGKEKESEEAHTDKKRLRAAEWVQIEITIIEER